MINRKSYEPLYVQVRKDIEEQEEVSLPTDTAMLLEEAYENGKLDSDRYAALYLPAVTDPERAPAMWLPQNTG